LCVRNRGVPGIRGPSGERLRDSAAGRSFAVCLERPGPGRFAGNDPRTARKDASLSRVLEATLSRKRLVLAGSSLLLLIVAAVLFSRDPAGPVPGPAARPSGAFEVGIPTAQEVRNMLGVYGERVESTERDLAALRAKLQETQRKLDESG